MIDTAGGATPSLPFELTLENLDEANKSLMGMFQADRPLEGEIPHVTEDDFRGMSAFFPLLVEESHDPLFKNTPEGLAPKEQLKARAGTRLRHASIIKNRDLLCFKKLSHM